jgi:hypothetical protein
MLLLELDPFRSEGNPKLNTELFFCAVTRAGEVGLTSGVGDVLAFGRRPKLADAFPPDGVGDTCVPVGGRGRCIDCDDDRRKNGIDGASPLFDGPLRSELDGLSGACAADVVRFVLALELVPDRLGPRRSGVLDVATAGGGPGDLDV